MINVIFLLIINSYFCLIKSATKICAGDLPILIGPTRFKKCDSRPPAGVLERHFLMIDRANEPMLSTQELAEEYMQCGSLRTRAHDELDYL